jgi:WD40 repeat protein
MKLIASGADDRSIYLWNILGRKKIIKTVYNNSVTSLAFNGVGNKLALSISSNPIFDKV